MKWLTIDYIKKHSRIDYDCEDELLELYAKSAEDVTLNYINRTLEEVLDVYGEIPSAIIQASLMLVDVSYTHRSPISTTNISVIPYTFDSLTKPYMKL